MSGVGGPGGCAPPISRPPFTPILPPPRSGTSCRTSAAAPDLEVPPNSAVPGGGGSSSCSSSPPPPPSTKDVRGRPPPAADCSLSLCLSPWRNPLCVWGGGGAGGAAPTPPQAFPPPPRRGALCQSHRCATAAAPPPCPPRCLRGAVSPPTPPQIKEGGDSAVLVRCVGGGGLTLSLGGGSRDLDAPRVAVLLPHGRVPAVSLWRRPPPPCPHLSPPRPRAVSI